MSIISTIKSLFTPRPKVAPATSRPRPRTASTTEITIPAKSLGSIASALEEAFAESAMEDYLSPAAEAGAEAARAVKAGEYDKAWAAYQEQKMLYMQHAQQSGFTGRQTIALDSSVHAGMANVLRLEKRHREALAHAIYAAFGGTKIPSETARKKVAAYLKRSGLKSTSMDDIDAFFSAKSRAITFQAVRKQVAHWLNAG